MKLYYNVTFQAFIFVVPSETEVALGPDTSEHSPPATIFGWRGVMDRTAVVKVGAAASASVCALFGGVVLAQYIVAKKKRAGKKTRIIEMVSQKRHAALAVKDKRKPDAWVTALQNKCTTDLQN